MKLIYTDWDGYKYFRNEAGRIVDQNGCQVSIAEEYNIQQILYYQFNCLEHKKGRIEQD